MSGQSVDPGVRALLDEVDMLPECAAALALLERAACAAEALGDLSTAWTARCRILSSSSAHAAPRFEDLFMSLAWCLAVSDREPERFGASSVLWQYKWVATAAPEYAGVPRSVLERIIEDLRTRYAKAGWGVRAALHKQLEIWSIMGEYTRAASLVPEWRAAPRDRGADCLACEASFLVDLLANSGQDKEAVREARPLMSGRLSCVTVPHSTFGTLLLPLTRLGRHDEALGLYDRGRRLVASMSTGRCTLTAPYLAFASFIGEIEQALAMLRATLPEAMVLRSDRDRALWFGYAGVAAQYLNRRDVQSAMIGSIADIVEDPEVRLSELARQFSEIAQEHSGLLDRRNGNSHYSKWLATLPAAYGMPPDGCVLS